MKLYDKKGYFNAKAVLDSGYPFIFGVGSRGIGKTYSILQELIKSKRKFILLRTTEDEAKMCGSAVGNPFKKLNMNNKWDITVKPINAHMWGVYENTDSNNYLGLIMALTTFSKVRGMDLSDIEVIFYDEYIAERIQKKIPALGESLFNAYETTNRNRELEGLAPVQMVCMANALNLNNDILIKWGIVTILQKMKKKGNQVYEDKDRNMLVIYPDNSPISALKEETVLYKISMYFNDMALANKFREYYEKNIKSENLKNYKMIMVFDDMAFYKCLCKRQIYISSYCKGTVKPGCVFGNTDFEQNVFRKKYYWLIDMYYNGLILFESPELELSFLNLMKIV